MKSKKSKDKPADMQQAVVELFQTYLERLDDDESHQLVEEVPDDVYQGPQHIIRVTYEQLYRKQKHKVPKARIEEILAMGKCKVLEKLLRDVTALEDREDATLEEVYSMPITSDALLQRIQEFEAEEVLKEKMAQLEEIAEQRAIVMSEQFVKYFTYEDVTEAEQNTENPALKALLRSCISAHKRIVQMGKRNQYVTEKICAEIEKFLDGSPMTTPEIQAFRHKAQQLSMIVNHPQLDQTKITEFVQLAQTNRFDAKVVASLKQKQQELTAAAAEFAKLKSLPISQDKLAEVENLHHTLKSNNLYLKEIFELATSYHYVSTFAFKWHSLFFVQKYQFDDVIAQLLENEIIIPDQPKQLGHCLATLKELDQQLQLIGSETPIPQLIEKFRLTYRRCQNEQLLLDLRSHRKIDPTLLLELTGTAPQQLADLAESTKLWMADYLSLTRNPIETLLNSVLMSHYNQLQQQILKLIKLGAESPLNLSDKVNQLLSLYLQLVWMYKADTLLRKRAVPNVLQILLTYATALRIPEQVDMVRQVRNRLALYETVQLQLSEYVKQRAMWKHDREREVLNLKNVRQQLLYISAKPSYDQVSSIANDAKLLTIPPTNLNTMLSDLQNAENMIATYNDLDLSHSKSQLTPASVQSLLDIKRIMLYSFLRVEHLATLVLYFINKHQLMKSYSEQENLTNIQQKMQDFNAIVQKESWLQNALHKQQHDLSQLPTFVAKFLQNESFVWIHTIEETLEVDILAHSLKERIPQQYQLVRDAEAENRSLHDEDRLQLREKHCVDFAELEEFVVGKIGSVRYQHDLSYLVQQHEACRKLLFTFEEMVDRLKEFQLKFELEKLEALIDHYLEGSIQVHIREMSQLMQYIKMARAFWAEVLDQQDTMRQPVLDRKTHKAVNDFLRNFVETQKKFNVEIPEVKRFAEEYFEVLRKVEQVQSGGNDLSTTRQWLLKEVPQQLRCVDVFQECHLQLWMSIAEEFLATPPIVVWSQTRLFTELTEGYKLLEQAVCKLMPMNEQEAELALEQFSRMRYLIVQLETLYEEVDIYLRLDNPDLSKPYEDRIQLQENSGIQFVLKKPFTSWLEYVQKLRVRYFSRSKQQAKKRDPRTLRVRARVTAKPIAKVPIPIQATSKPIKKIKPIVVALPPKPKKKQPDVPVPEQLRVDKRIYLCAQLKRNPSFIGEPIEQRVKVIESHVFGDYHDQRQLYEEQLDTLRKLFKVIETLKYVSKRVKRKEFDFGELMVYASKMASLPKLDEEIARKLGKAKTGPKLLQIKTLIHKAPRKQQTKMVDLILRQQRMQNFPKLVPQQVRRDEEEVTLKKVRIEDSPSPILYNPDTSIKENYSDVYLLGQLVLKLKPKDLAKKKQVIKPQLLTCDGNDQIILFPSTLLRGISIYQKATCNVAQVTEYMTQHKEQFKVVRGWLHTSSLEEALELEALAKQMKDEKVSIGTRCYENLIGVSLVHVDHMPKHSPSGSKWVLPADLVRDPAFISKMTTYEQLHLLKPQIAFFLYIKDFNAYTLLCEKSHQQPGGLKGQPFNYVSVYKVPQLNQLINVHREYQRSTRELHKLSQTPLPEFNEYPQQPRTPSYHEMYQNRNSYEPISDEEDIHISHENRLNALTVLNRQRDSADNGLQGEIFRKIPNILNLLNNDDEGDQD